MKIPKRFQLLNSTVTVRVIGKRDWDALTEDYDIENSVGAWRYQDQAIVLLRQKRPLLFATYTHELTHAILDAMGDKLSYNEKWVEQFAGLLAQALETAE